jgi:hypothetical protein
MVAWAFHHILAQSLNSRNQVVARSVPCLTPPVPFYRRLSLEARDDFSNLLNHPNFGSPINSLTSPQFGQATRMLNNYMGSGGQSGALNPPYRIVLLRYAGTACSTLVGVCTLVR